MIIGDAVDPDRAKRKRPVPHMRFPPHQASRPPRIPSPRRETVAKAPGGPRLTCRASFDPDPTFARGAADAYYVLLGVSSPLGSTPGRLPQFAATRPLPVDAEPR